MKCNECHNEFDETAGDCPVCVYINTPEPKESFLSKLGYGIFGGAFGVVGCLVYCVAAAIPVVIGLLIISWFLRSCS